MYKKQKQLTDKAMGGITGHLMHPIDNLNLKTTKLVKLCQRSLEGKLKMSEKIDGFNLQVIKVSNKNSTNAWRLIRSKTDILEGGITYKGLQKRFEHNPIAYELYKRAIDILSELPKEVFDKFELYSDTNKSYNCEILKKDGITNSIEYKNNAELYVHNVWIWNDNVEVKPLGFTLNEENCKSDPVIKYEKKNKGNKYINKLIKELGNHKTIKDYYRRKFQEYMVVYADNLDTKMIDVLFERTFCDNKEMNLRDIKKILKDKVDDVENFISLLPTFKIFIINKLDNIILNLGQIILSNCSNYINYNNIKAKDFNGLYKNPHKTKESSRHYMRHFSLDNTKLYPLEGIVVEFDGNLYKWTGAFAPYNRVCNELSKIVA